MPAHLRSLVVSCYEDGCERSATVEARTTSNSVIGRYCESHGRKIVAEWKKLEETTRREGADRA